MSRILTHGRSGPRPGRLDRLVEDARAEAKLAELDRRHDARVAAAREGKRAPRCPECGLCLLPGEAGVCRHCGAKD